MLRWHVVIIWPGHKTSDPDVTKTDNEEWGMGNGKLKMGNEKLKMEN